MVTTLGKFGRPCKSATVAQLVEQRFRKPQVVGSNPTRGSILANLLASNHAEGRTTQVGIWQIEHR